jgi:hypothetical protein
MPTHNDPPHDPRTEPRTAPVGPGTGHDLGRAPGKDLRKVPNQDATALHSVGEGYEVTDVSVGGVGVFLVALSVTLVIFFVFAFGMGKVINIVLRRSDGPPSPWQQAGASASGGVSLKGKNMESSPAIEQKQLHQLTEAFPTPRLQTDDGDQDLADLHEREDLLLNHYSYIDPAQGKVRIPIDRAMQLIAQRGLPVVPQSSQAGAQAQLMFGDVKPVVQVPLTSGFARTGYEQERESPVGLAGDQASAKADNY